MTTPRNDRSVPGAREQVARHRQVGILLVVLAGVFWSLQGPAVRMIEVASGPQIVFWRSIGQLSVMLVVVAIVNRSRVLSAFRLAGYRAVVGGVCAASAGRRSSQHLDAGRRRRRAHRDPHRGGAAGAWSRALPTVEFRP